MASDTDIIMPKWAQQDNGMGRLSTFPEGGDQSWRLRRVERALQFKRRGSVVGSSNGYQSVSSSVVDSSGTIPLNDPASFSVMGSMAPYVISGNFGYTSDGTSIHLYWDGTNSSAVLVVKRADGSSFTVPSGDINVTNLANSTTYYFYPYWSTFGGCNVSFVVGDSGDDPAKFAHSSKSSSALYEQTLLGREALSTGSFTAATTGGGAGGGGAGGGGGSGLCVMHGTSIEPVLDSWDYEVRIFPETDWVRILCEKGTLSCTKGHRLYRPDGSLVESGSIRPGEWLVHKEGDVQVDEVINFKRACTKWKVEMKMGHLYFANGFLSHNSKAAEV